MTNHILHFFSANMRLSYRLGRSSFHTYGMVRNIASKDASPPEQPKDDTKESSKIDASGDFKDSNAASQPSYAFDPKSTEHKSSPVAPEVVSKDKLDAKSPWEEMVKKFQQDASLQEDYIRNHPLSKQALENAKGLRKTNLHLQYFSPFDKYVRPLDEFSSFQNFDEYNAFNEEKFKNYTPPADIFRAKPPVSYTPFSFGTTNQGATMTDFLVETTGVPKSYLQSFVFVPLVIRRVVNQTRKGKIPSIYVLTVVGNRNGVIGYGEGKAANYSLSYKQSCARAVKSMKCIPRYEDRTVYGNLHKKFHAVRLALRSRPAGFGLRCNAILFEICRCAGIKDLSGEIMGSKNGMNVVKAVFEALHEQALPEDIAMQRGLKIVDVQREYYKGSR
ncbi:ribosomal protein subunit S5 [Schizosaccharomyces cryophilus OY26]|uniref:Small ribosomal subunit protein uS5m n=1 Tax=Schizosaccharomyces cryophilus (strain OY26 / ATCC MYA-4695 / CBS 11777 / NBRC 106824 / NRRL Y48691) TaxID=653667 RepID=S9W1F5_SCHCR|nr:ribosomal protein subunit S5 [Schizosaccharomyces cryophilus OY26]EPY51815.1 ribosomal protein subunit S5 [Schizosaccharomyces cryophilus OY26]